MDGGNANAAKSFANPTGSPTACAATRRNLGSNRPVPCALAKCSARVRFLRRTPSCDTAAESERRQHEKSMNTPQESNTQRAAVDHQRLVRQGGRLRQLIDGRWVAEERHGWWIFAKWIAIDLRTPRHLWTPDCQFYKDCIGTYEEAIRGLSMRGFSLPNDKDVQPRERL